MVTGFTSASGLINGFNQGFDSIFFSSSPPSSSRSRKPSVGGEGSYSSSLSTNSYTCLAAFSLALVKGASFAGGAGGWGASAVAAASYISSSCAYSLAVAKNYYGMAYLPLLPSRHRGARYTACLYFFFPSLIVSWVEATLFLVACK